MFLENRCSESRTLRTGVDEISCIFYVFHATLAEFCVGGAYKKLLHDCELHETRRTDSHCA